MGYAEFKDQFYGLRGGTNEAARACLRRYFHLMKRGKDSLRRIFSEQELREIGAVIADRHIQEQPDRDIAALEEISGDVSESCGEKISELGALEQIALVDAIERTLAMKRGIRKLAEPPILII